uniref:tyrosine--tRNA ligase n=1 Tax=Triticum urartu TaxID=4572 RepID=A0A8R7UNM4_TRIUA
MGTHRPGDHAGVQRQQAHQSRLQGRDPDGRLVRPYTRQIRRPKQDPGHRTLHDRYMEGGRSGPQRGGVRVAVGRNKLPGLRRNNSLGRTVRCCGSAEPSVEYRELIKPDERGDVVGARVVYTCMQCATVLFQKADVWLLSMDHEDVGTLTREYCRDMKGEEHGPIILSHSKLPNLILDHEHARIQDPMFAIFMEDEERDVPVKIRNTHYPAKVAEGNPCLEYIKHIVLPWFGCFEVPGKEENG